jgi:hypothetical protein
MPSTQRLLELALKGLEAERKRVDDEIRQLRQQVRGTEEIQQPQRTGSKMAAPRRRRKMSPAAKKLISQRMREVWAQRRKGA